MQKFSDPGEGKRGIGRDKKCGGREEGKVSEGMEGTKMEKGKEGRKRWKGRNERDIHRPLTKSLIRYWS